MKQTLLLLITGLLAAVTPAATALKPGTTILKTAVTYTLSAANDETAEYTLTTNGTTLAANLEINTNTSGTVILTLQNFSISHARPILITGSGTVIFKTAGTTASTITHNTGTWGDIQYPYAIGTGTATLRFQLGSSAPLNITAAKTAVNIFNIVPVYALNNPVFIESGTLCCTALCTAKTYVANFPLTPAIRATAITLSGETTALVPAFRVAETGLTGTTAATQPSPVYCTTFTCTGGTIRSEGTPVTSETDFKINTVYAYPDASFNSLIKQAQGGTILNKKIFHFPGWTPVDDTDYSACFTNAVPAALTVNTDARTIAVDLSTSPDAEPVYTADSCADAATLFGADTVPTSEGLKVAYAFGIDRLTSDGSAVFARVAVDLPKVTEETATFHLEIFEAGTEAPVYSGNPVFTREAADSIRFVTDPISVLKGLARSASVTRAYTVTAVTAEAATE